VATETCNRTTADAAVSDDKHSAAIIEIQRLQDLIATFQASPSKVRLYAYINIFLIGTSKTVPIFGPFGGQQSVLSRLVCRVSDRGCGHRTASHGGPRFGSPSS